MTTRQVVVGYDGSHFSRKALTWGLRAAKARGIPLLIAHAGRTPTPLPGFVTLVEPDPRSLLDEDALAEACRSARLDAPGVEVTSVEAAGAPVPVLLTLMADAEVGVVGCRGLGTFAELLVGSTSEQLASHATCPLVVVRTSYYSVPGPDSGRVVVGTDTSPGSSAAVDFAFEEARVRGCGLTVVHAWDVVGHMALGGSGFTVRANAIDAEHAAAQAVCEWLEPWIDKHPDVDVRQRLVRGAATTALVNASAGAELLVVGSRGLGGFRSLLLGSVSHALLHHANSPVAVIHPPDVEPAG